jgi:hypothetical protein
MDDDWDAPVTQTVLPPHEDAILEKTGVVEVVVGIRDHTVPVGGDSGSSPSPPGSGSSRHLLAGDAASHCSGGQSEEGAFEQSPAR